MFGASEDTTSRCQSCGMELSVHNFGTNASGSMNFDYCNYCFQIGVFIEPEITLSEMIEKSARLMTDEDTTQGESFKMAQKTIPHLKRWKKSS